MTEEYPLPSPKEVLIGETKKKSTIENTPWKLFAISKRVLKTWKSLVKRCPEESTECYRIISNNALQRKRGVYFPLRGKDYKGGWEYRVNGADRLFCKPIKESKRVIVYYADKHPKGGNAPTPP